MVIMEKARHHETKAFFLPFNIFYIIYHDVIILYSNDYCIKQICRDPPGNFRYDPAEQLSCALARVTGFDKSPTFPSLFWSKSCPTPPHNDRAVKAGPSLL